MNNPYEILGVGRNATEKDIMDAYRRIAGQITHSNLSEYEINEILKNHTGDYWYEITLNDQQIDNLVSLLDGYATNGGHHLNVNVLNRDTLLDAQKHPENYKNLIVRVWGWSGYFNELDLVYQNHIIKRLEFTN